jgi:hypothetical protein
MRFSKLTQITSIFMIVLLPASMFATETSGMMLYPQGTITVNGNSVSHSQAGFDGDRYQTAKDSSLVMSGSGSSIQVAPSSDVTYRNSTLQLNSGGAAITTKNGMASHLVNLTVKPMGEQARYSIAQNDSQIVIGAEEGSIIVSDGTSQRVVPQGKALLANLEPLSVAADQNTSNQSTQDDQGNKNKKKGAGAPPAASGGGGGVTLSKTQLILIGGGVGAAIIALAILLALKKPASN